MTSAQFPQAEEKTLLSRNFTHIVIPAEIWLRRDISIQSKALWAELRSLHDKEKGGCYASNDYLMEFMGLKYSRLKELFVELKNAGLLEDVSFDGRITIRRAIVPEVEYVTGQQLATKPASSNQLAGKPASCGSENRLAPLYIENKEENKDRTPPNPQGGNAPSGAILLSSIHKEIKESYGSHVKLTKSEHKQLAETYGSKELDKLIIEMNDYCASVGKSYKDYAATIRTWFRKRQENPNPSKPKPLSNLEFVKLHFQNNGNYKGATCYINDDQIAFERGMTHRFISFKSNGFKEQLNQILILFGIKTL